MTGIALARHAGFLSYVAPTVSAVANGDSNSCREDICSSNSCGVEWNTDGNEYETNRTTFDQNIGQWLDTGLPQSVWVIFTRTANSNFQTLSSSVRYQINVNRRYSNTRSTVGTTTSSGYFQFYDAASGGNLLDRAPDTGSVNYVCTITADPCPICCFTPETPILMESGFYMPIGKIKEGDRIYCLDGPETVTEIITRRNRVMYRITLADGTWIEASEDHPFDVKGEPKSINPIVEYKDIGMPGHLKVGDTITNSCGKNIYITDITKINFPGTVYTLGNKMFFAKGLLVY